MIDLTLLTIRGEKKADHEEKGKDYHMVERSYGSFARSLQLPAGVDPNAIVLLHNLCYASGNSEWGWANPTKATAIKRVDNYAAGFLRTGARPVFAEGIYSASYILYSLFRTSRTINQTFWVDPSRSGAYDFSFASLRTPGKIATMDPSSPGRYYRSVVGDLGMTAATWRAG